MELATKLTDKIKSKLLYCTIEILITCSQGKFGKRKGNVTTLFALRDHIQNYTMLENYVTQNTKLRCIVDTCTIHSLR